MSVRVHLRVCDFCGAEFRLLSKYAPSASSDAAAAESAAVAAHVRRLAEDLLSDPEQATAKLIESFYEVDSVKVAEAQL